MGEGQLYIYILYIYRALRIYIHKYLILIIHIGKQMLPGPPYFFLKRFKKKTELNQTISRNDLTATHYTTHTHTN